MTEIQFVDKASATLLRCMASDSIVAESARVSTKGASSLAEEIADMGFSGHVFVDRRGERDAGLINSLMKERHGVPFEHCVFTFAVEAPLFVVPQLLKHRMSSISQESGRYREMRPVFYLPGPDRKVAQVGKAMAYDMRDGTAEQSTLAYKMLGHGAMEALGRYQLMLEAGITKELARAVLPPNLMASLIITLNARSLMNVLSLRVADEASTYPSHPQREIEMVAEDMELAFAEHMPATHAAFIAAGRVAP